MPARTYEQRFRRRSATAAELEKITNEVLTELTDPTSEASVAANRAGLDPDALRGARAEVRDGEQGAEPFLTTLVIAIAVQVGVKAAESLWTDVLWPRIRRRLGADALGERVQDPADE